MHTRGTVDLPGHLSIGKLTHHSRLEKLILDNSPGSHRRARARGQAPLIIGHTLGFTDPSIHFRSSDLALLNVCVFAEKHLRVFVQRQMLIKRHFDDTFCEIDCVGGGVLVPFSADLVPLTRFIDDVFGETHNAWEGGGSCAC